MLGYTTIGAKDFEKSKTFYDTILTDLGGKRIFGSDRIQFYGSGQGGMLAVCIPYDKNDPAPGNGNMIALSAPSNEVVDKVYKKRIGPMVQQMKARRARVCRHSTAPISAIWMATRSAFSKWGMLVVVTNFPPRLRGWGLRSGGGGMIIRLPPPPRGARHLPRKQVRTD